MADTEYWQETSSKDLIVLAPNTGGGEGFTVELRSTQHRADDQARRTYCPDIPTAARRVVWLMRQFPGEWQRVSSGESR